ncbi:hypothetical protein [Streptomyces sp. 8L]|uniref:hypothetical protein n=1 Tax=Streptomyces sp. 8L TaxID=2877242 RepID=UPI001CD21BEA|nr:hypothetical protein [Streptomyces sp. 8L]MCA1218852.1 hypothetical protein [Streptomyces sp. 8L]
MNVYTALRLADDLSSPMLDALHVWAKNPQGSTARTNNGRGGGTHGAMVRRGMVALGVDENGRAAYFLTSKAWGFLAAQYGTVRPADAGRLTLDQALAEAYPEIPAAAPRSGEVVIPGALADYLSQRTASDDETWEALDGAHRGRGRTLIINPASTRVLHVISRYAEHILAIPGAYTRATLDAARLWIKRAGHAPALMVHRFDDTASAYNGSQCRDDVRDGDVLVVESEKVVAYLRGAWPAAVTAEHGELHTLTADPRTLDDGRFADSAIRAERIATEYGFALAEYGVDAAAEAEQRFERSAYAVEAVEHAEQVEAAVETVEEAEALYAAQAVTEAEADGGTWRGKWIGEQADDALFPVDRPADQGALFAPAVREPIVARASFRPDDLAQLREKAAADREAYRAATDDKIAAECAAHGVAPSQGVADRIAARTASQAPERRVIEGVIVTHTGTAEGSTPSNASHPDVLAARAALDGLAVATMTDHHDVTDPTEDEQHVRGYLIDPRTQGRVAVYWLEGGRTVRRDQMPHGPALDCLADRLKRRGWAVEKMLRSSACVFAHRPTTT